MFHKLNKSCLAAAVLAAGAFHTVSGNASTAATFDVLYQPVAGDISTAISDYVTVSDNGTVNFSTVGGNNYAVTSGSSQIIVDGSLELSDKPAGFHTYRVSGITASDGGYFVTVNERQDSLPDNEQAGFNSIAYIKNDAATTVLRSRANAPGINAAFYTTQWKANASGQFITVGELDTTTGVANSTNKYTLIGGNSNGGTSVLIRQGQQIQGLAVGVQWGAAYTTTNAAMSGFNDNGYISGLWGTQVDDGDGGVVTGNTVAYLLNSKTGATTIMARLGDNAVNSSGGSTSATYYSYVQSARGVSLSSDNYGAVAIRIKDGAANKWSVFVGNESGTRRWITSDDVITDRGLSFTVGADNKNSSKFVSDVASGGRVLCGATGTIGGSSATALLFGSVGDVHIVAAAGDTAYGMANGVTIKTVTGSAPSGSTAQANDLGQVVFLATLSNNESGYFASTAEGLFLLFSSNSTLTASDGTSYTIDSFTRSGSAQGLAVDTYSALNDSGIFAFNYDGIGFSIDLNTLSAPVPEPATLGVLGLAAGMMLRRRK